MLRSEEDGCVLHSQILRIREEDSHLGESTARISCLILGQNPISCSLPNSKSQHVCPFEIHQTRDPDFGSRSLTAAAGKDYHGIDVVLFAWSIFPSSPLKSTINRQEVENPTPTTPAPTKFLLLPTKTQLKSPRSVTTFFSRFASTKN
ncbi:hypothetical protein C1H46_009950 [Malus baccata]|uniref:Uncharacterized protein n=1 Tax=Malus baccata TaxID=106549 RepID=A0A540N1M5_MALBA|nr:hypothetical protein C1H46_009950 [Malus baccata]